MPQQKTRDCLSLFDLTAPPEDWGDKGGTVPHIQSALQMKTSQYQKIVDVIVNKHYET